MESFTKIAGNRKNAKPTPRPRMLPQSEWTMSRRADRRTKLAATHKAFRRGKSALIRELGSQRQIGYDPQSWQAEQIGYDSQNRGQDPIGYDSQNDGQDPIGYDPQNDRQDPIGYDPRDQPTGSNW